MTTPTKHKPEWALSDLNIESDWDVLVAFLSEPRGYDDADPVEWANDYVSELLNGNDWAAYEVPFGRQPFDFRRDAEEHIDSLIDQVGDAIARELEPLAVDGSTDYLVSGKECPRGHNRIYRSEVLTALCEWCERCDGTGWNSAAGETDNGRYGPCSWCGGEGLA